MAYLTINGKKVFYWEAGSGETTLFFVHGNSSSSQTFARQFESSLANRFRLIAIDLPGTGQSDRLDHYSISGLTETIVECFKALQLNSSEVIAVGHSLGGHLLLQASHRLGDLRGLVVSGTPPLGNPPRPDLAFHPNPQFSLFLGGELNDTQIETAALELFSTGAAIPAFVFKDLRRTDPNFRINIGQSLQSLLSTGFQDELKIVEKLPYPLILVCGVRDKFVNVRYFEASGFSDSPRFPRPDAVRYFEHSGHCAHWEEDEKFNDLLIQLIDSREKLN